MSDANDTNNDFTFEKKSCWDVYNTEQDRAAMNDLAERYIEFLSTCKTERETVEYVVDKLKAAGFGEDFAGDAVYRNFRGKAVFMARKGEKPLAEGVRLLGAHGDTPRLDLKPRAVYEDAAMGLAKTHYYGGIRKYQWFARPLALHGVVIKADGSRVDIVIGEDPSDPVITILDLLPHLAQNQVKKVLSEAFEAEKMNLVFGHEPMAAENNGSDDDNGNGGKVKEAVKKKVLAVLNERFGLVEEDFFSAELQAVPAGPARYVGLDGSLIGGYGQDDRACVFCCLEAFLNAPQPEHTQAVIFWDKEEIGSDGATGAQSMFMEYCFEDLIKAWEPDTDSRQMYLATKALSTDVHGALDPDYQEVHEKMNASVMGYGPVLCKYTGSRGKYGASDADAEYVAFLRKLLNDNGIPWQAAELGKVDLGGGGTVAKYLAAYGMDILDSGPSVLSMHSPFEVSSKVDLYATTLFYKAFMGS